MVGNNLGLWLLDAWVAIGSGWFAGRLLVAFANGINMMILANDSVGWAWVFNQGFAAGLLLLTAFGLYYALRWFGAAVVIPVRDALVAHLSATTATMKDIGQTLEGTHDEIKLVRERIASIDNRTESMAKAISENHMAVIRLHADDRHGPPPPERSGRGRRAADE